MNRCTSSFLWTFIVIPRPCPILHWWLERQRVSWFGCLFCAEYLLYSFDSPCFHFSAESHAIFWQCSEFPSTIEIVSSSFLNICHHCKLINVCLNNPLIIEILQPATRSRQVHRFRLSAKSWRHPGQYKSRQRCPLRSHNDRHSTEFGL